jgi:hypothetical protein
MGEFNVLFIAPEIANFPRLALWDEAYQLEDIRGVNVEKLMGPGVDRRRLQAALERPYDVILWAGHGQAGRLPIAGGYITPRALANTLRKHPPQVIIVSACFSAVRDDKVMSSIAECLASAGIDTIAMLTSVEDKAAIVYDVELVRCLAQGSEFDEAHESALEALRSMNGKGAAVAPMQFYGKHTPAQPATGSSDISAQLAEINAKLDTIMDLIHDASDVSAIQKQMIDYLRESQQAILQVVQTISKAQPQ